MASSSRKVIYAALVGNGLIAFTKFIAAFVTGSSAMLSEGIHSVVDTGNQFLLLHGLRQARKPPDENFPFGHGKEVYFWCFIVAILIFAVGGGMSFYEGLHQIQDPKPIKSVTMSYIVLALAVVFESFAWIVAYREFGTTRKKRQSLLSAVQASKDPTTFTVLFEDSAAMLGILVAFFGILLGQITGIPYFDGIASIIIGLILGCTSAWLVYETHGLIIGERASREIVSGIRKLVRETARVEQVNEVLTLHM